MEEEVFPGVTLEELAASAGVSELPPMAGGAPGILSEFGDAWGWAEGSVLDPIAGFFGDVGDAVAHAVIAGVGGLLSVAGWWSYKWLDALIGDADDIGWRSTFPHPDNVIGLPPWYYLHKVVAMVWKGTGTMLDDLGEWLVEALTGVGGAVGSVVGPALDVLWGWIETALTELYEILWFQIESSIGWLMDWIFGPHMWVKSLADWVIDEAAGVATAVGGAVADTASWLWGLVAAAFGVLTTAVSEAASWVWSQVSAIVGAIPGGFLDLVGWLGSQFWDVLTAIGDIAWEGGAWLWDQISAGFQEVKGAVVGAVVAGGQAIGEVIREAIEWVINEAFEPFVDVFAAKFAIPGKLLRGEYDDVEALIDDLMDPPNELLRAGALIALTPFYLIVGLLLAFFPPYRPILNKLEWGVAAVVGGTLPPFQMLRDGFRRELMHAGEHDEWLRKAGYTAELVELQRELYEEIPGPTDLVRMGVREVFTPEIAERFGQFEDFPPEFGDWMAKQGFTEEWALNYWGAHWDLPSVTQAFEMFHRGVIADEELMQLLRALDVMPYWRPKLRDIAYRVVTRVDVRRMYQEGVFDRGQVLKVYNDLGYTPEDAEALTEFVVRRYPPGGRDTEDQFRSLTATAIRDALARRVISRDDALDRLQELDYTADDADLVVSLWELKWLEDADGRSDVAPKTLARSIIERAYERRLITLNAGVTELGEVGYTPEDARLLLELVDLKLEERVADLEVDVILNDYDAGMITEAEMAARLGALHIPQARVDYLVRLEIARRQGKTRRLTLAQLEEGLRREQLSEAAFRVRLDRMGYNVPDIEILTLQAGGSVTIGQLQTAYRAGVLTEPQLRLRLAELAVAPRDVDLLIPVAVRRPSVAQLQEAFRRGEMVEATFRVRLAELAVEPRDVDLLVAITPRLPSLSELRKGFDSGIVTEAQLRARFAELGYAPADVELLMALTLEVA